MLIPLNNLYRKYRIKATGIIHVGASTGQEYIEYSKHGLKDQIWIEAIPEVYERLRRRLSFDPYVMCLNACVSDVTGKEVTFHVANNEGQSSSYLELGHHLKIHPEVHYVREFKTKTITLDDLIPDASAYQFLAADVQGAELDVLKGATETLKNINYLYLEVNKKETYTGCATIDQIDAYLTDFKRVETAPWVADTWSDAFYIRK